VPLHFAGGNGPLFHLAGLLHRRLRTLLLPRVLLGQQGHELSLRVGAAIAPGTLAALPDPASRTAYLRWRTYLLAPPRPRAPARLGLGGPPAAKLAPLATPRPAHLIEAELAILPAEARLLTQGEHQVWVARASQVPQAFAEIARLRELSFRAAGE